MIKNKLTLLTLLLTFISVSVFGQTWNFGDQPDVAKTNNALYTDALKAKKYEKAKKPLDWLLVNTPDLNSSLYINGAKVYENLVKLAKDNPERQRILQDSTMIIYDLRIKYFGKGKEGYILNRKALKAYSYYKKDESKYKELLDLFADVFAKNPLEKISGNNAMSYMNMIYRTSKSEYKMTEEQIIDKYDTFSEMLDKQLAEGKKPESIEKYRKFIDNIFTKMVDIDCEFIKTKLGPRLEKDKTNIKLARQIVKFSLQSKCLDLPVALTAAEIVNEDKPDYGVSLLIAIKSKGAKDYAKSQKYFTEALALTSDKSKQADVHIHLGDIKSYQGQKSAARTEYKKALGLKPGMSKAYRKIGDLYFGSFNTCAKKDNYLEDRGVYLAAYKYYKLAGSTSAMNKAKAQFPSSEDIFSQNKAVGDKMTVGCWINEEVTIMKR